MVSIARLGRFCLVAVVVLAFVAAADGGQRFGVYNRPKAQGPKFVPGEVLVKFRAGTGKAAAAAALARHGGQEVYASKAGFRRVRVPKGKAVADVVAALNRDPAVECAQPNTVCRAAYSPNDPLYSSQWHLDDAGSPNPYGGANGGGINVEPAWDVSRGQGVIVAVLDSGVAYENYNDKAAHKRYSRAPDLANTSFAPGYDFINNDSHPNDDNSHGTHVAGTIAQSTNNATGVAGVAFMASIMPVKVLDAAGYGSAAELIDGLHFAADHGAKVINMSLSWGVDDNGEAYDPGQMVHEAVIYAYNAGCVIVCAAGNDGENAVAFPAAYPECIAVGATRYDETRSGYSNHGLELDIAAPGGDLGVDQDGDGYGDGVLQNTFNPISGNVRDFGYWYFDGTSMASPHVAGVAALVIASGVSDPVAVRDRLLSTAEDKGAPGWDAEYGHGIVDAAAAVNAVGPPAPVATDDSYAVAVDGQLSTSEPSLPGVLANDTDPEGDPLTAVLRADVSNGSLTLNGDGSFTYTPDAGFAGEDSFTYVANDGQADSNEATVTIQVLGAYRIPDAELMDTGQFLKLWGDADASVGPRTDLAGEGVLYSVDLGAGAAGSIAIGDNWELSSNLALDWDDGGGYHVGHYTSLAAYGCYEMVVSYVDGPVGSTIDVSLFLNTGLTGPSGFPSDETSNDTFWRGGSITIAQGETKVVRLDFSSAKASNISDNQVPHTGGGLGWPEEYLYAINDRDRHELTNIGIEIANSSSSAFAAPIEIELNTVPQPPEVHDVAVTSVLAPSPVVQGTPVDVVVTVANEGNQDETVTVSLTETPGGTPFTPQNVPVAPGTSEDVVFVWNTAGAAEGDHTLTASAAIAPGDATPGNNAASVIVTVNPQGSGVLQVASIQMGLEPAGKNTKATALVTVTQDDDPAASAAVSADWSLDGKAIGTSAGTTDALGRVTLVSPPKKVTSGQIFRVEITAITKTDYTYTVPDPPDAGVITVP